MKIKFNLPPQLKHQLMEFENIFYSNRNQIEAWIRNKFTNISNPFYGSIDIRNNGLKIAPVDMNLFPGGFNNLSPDSLPLAIESSSNYLEKYCPSTKKILLIPENHTRNTHYLKNVYTIFTILEQAGYTVVIGSLSPEITEPTSFKVGHNQTLVYHPIIKDHENGVIKTQNGFIPCVIILNNDLSSGRPQILENLEQTVIPPLNAGWYMRKKSNFFKQYSLICKELSQIIGIDPWLIDPLFDVAYDLDFANKSGLEALATKVERMFAKVRTKYEEYGIKEDPYLAVKANNGTYGMGIMMVSSGDDILNINRRSRNKMAIVKEQQAVHDVIIQEGIRTIEEIDQKTAEPVMYMINKCVIGSFYRTHAEKGISDNLNSVGAEFVTIPATCMYNTLHTSNKEQQPCALNQLYTYSMIAKLSMIAAGMELEEYK